MTSEELDALMDKDPLDLSAQDIDAIIAYQRKRRADFDAGIKPKKGGGEAKQSIDLVALGLVKAPPQITRRF